jgi:hypothetical protein
MAMIGLPVLIVIIAAGLGVAVSRGTRIPETDQEKRARLGHRLIAAGIQRTTEGGP